MADQNRPELYGERREKYISGDEEKRTPGKKMGSRQAKVRKVGQPMKASYAKRCREPSGIVDQKLKTAVKVRTRQAAKGVGSYCRPLFSSFSDVPNHIRVEQLTTENFVPEPRAQRSGLIDLKTTVTGSATGTPLREGLERLLGPRWRTEARKCSG